MQVQALTILSKICLAAGYASMVGSVALYATGRMRRDVSAQDDGIFVGLWVPTFFILSNRFELVAKEEEERQEFLIHSDDAQNTIEGRDSTNRSLPQAWRDEVREGGESQLTQSPRPLQHTRNRT